MSTNRRRFGRFTRALPVELIHEGRVYACTTQDLSLGGMRVSTLLTPPFDALVRFVLPLPVHEITVRGQGRVRWGQVAGTAADGLGICFDTLRPIEIWGLLQYFESSAIPGEHTPVMLGREGNRPAA